MRVPLPDLPCPCDSPIYLNARTLARATGLNDDFRWFCTLLEAPSDLRWLPLVADNLSKAINVAPKTWTSFEDFVPLKRTATWVTKNKTAIAKLISNENGTVSDVSDDRPMKGYWESFPIYTMMCQCHEDSAYQGVYRLLQLQLLSARAREVKEFFANDLLSYVEKYEKFRFVSGNVRICGDMKLPGPVATHVRLLKFRDAGRLLDFMQPQSDPTLFGEELNKRIHSDVRVPTGRHFTHRAESIAAYCHGLYSARAFSHRKRLEAVSAKSDLTFGYYAYSPTLAGMFLDLFDPDDHELNAPEQEVQLFGSTDAVVASDTDEPPEENALLGTIATDVTPNRNGVAPGQVARARASIVRLEVDRDIFPWSASQLRPAEILPTLLFRLREISLTTSSPATKAREDLETAALIAVCLETGRSPEQVFNFPFGDDPKGEFALIYRSKSDVAPLWCWTAIEPSLAKPRSFVEGKEASRALFLTNPVSGTTGHLLTALIRLASKHDGRVLFSNTEANYRERIKEWLKAIDQTGRVTIAKISRMQWSILAQITGNDYVEASMTLGFHHPRARVGLYYALMTVADAKRLFTRSCEILWGEEHSI
jgi:hypothetical protein